MLKGSTAHINGRYAQLRKEHGDQQSFERAIVAPIDPMRLLEKGSSLLRQADVGIRKRLGCDRRSRAMLSR